MAFPRTDIEDLKLQGATSNLRRALKREKDEGEPLEITPDSLSEIETLDALIRQAMRACRRGHTFRGKRNPAFANLASLMKCRDSISKGQKKSGKRTTAELLAEADKLLLSLIHI